MNKKSKKNKSFSVIELLIVVAIIAVMTSIGIAKFAGKKDKNILDQTVQQLVSDIRMAQNMAMNTHDCKNETGAGFGIERRSSNKYILYCIQSSAPTMQQLIKTIDLDQSLNFSPNINIRFVPPVPIIYINGSVQSNDAEIYINTKKIILNKFGQINVQ